MYERRRKSRKKKKKKNRTEIRVDRFQRWRKRRESAWRCYLTTINAGVANILDRKSAPKKKKRTNDQPRWTKRLDANETSSVVLRIPLCISDPTKCVSDFCQPSPLYVSFTDAMSGNVCVSERENSLDTSNEYLQIKWLDRKRKQRAGIRAFSCIGISQTPRLLFFWIINFITTMGIHNKKKKKWRAVKRAKLVDFERKRLEELNNKLKEIAQTPLTEGNRPWPCISAMQCADSQLVLLVVSNLDPIGPSRFLTSLFVSFIS